MSRLTAGAGPEGHQGPGPGGDERSSACSSPSSSAPGSWPRKSSGAAIYSVLSKPISAHQLPARQVRRPGADAGRQPGDDDASRSTLMLLYMDLTTDRLGAAGLARAGARPAAAGADRPHRCVQLTLVTAVALFFSTFSSPLLATLFTLGVWVAGHFSVDLRDFGTAVDSPAAAAVARALYYLLPNLVGARRQEPGRARPGRRVAGGRPRRGRDRRLHRAGAHRGAVRSSPAGTSSRPMTATVARASATVPWRRRGACSSPRSSRCRRPRPRHAAARPGRRADAVAAVAGRGPPR